MPDDPKAPAIRDTIFSAILPDEAAAKSADETTRRIFLEHALDGRPRPLSQYHITVLYFGLYVDLGDDGVEWAKRACAAAAGRTTPFQATLNQIKSFSSHPGRAAPLVLANEQKHAGFDACYQAAFDEARAVGLEVKRERYTPHFTTAYSMKRVSPQAIEPISWEVGELVLIRSYVGQTRYEELGRWCLTA